MAKEIRVASTFSLECDNRIWCAQFQNKHTLEITSVDFQEGKGREAVKTLRESMDDQGLDLDDIKPLPIDSSLDKDLRMFHIDCERDSLGNA